MDHLEIGELRVAFERAGDGPPVVLLHGFLSDSRSWLLQVHSMAEWFTVAVWDAPGCGASSDPPESFRMPDYADCLAELIDRLDLGPSHVVGLSFGAALALELYRRHPTLVRSLVLVSAYAGWGGSLPPEVVRERREQALRDSERPASEWVPQWAPGALSPSASTDLRSLVAAAVSQFHPVGYRTTAQSLADADLRDVLPEIAVPTLLIHGREDQRSPMDVARELHRAIPGSRLVLLTEIGHLPNVEAPERLNQEVIGFLRSIEDDTS